MFAAFKAELRKMFTVRTTYGITGVSLLIVILYAFYIEGMRAGDSVHSAIKLASEVPGALQAVGALGAVVALLLMTHEYRYNTIMYTLTSTRRRITVLIAKVLAVSVFALLFAVLVGALAPVMAYAGLSIKGLHLVAQQFPLWDLVWQGAFFTWAYMMFGLLFAMLFRSQVASIIVLLFAPGLVESLAGLLLKGNVKYLPFNAMSEVLQAGMQSTSGRLSAGHAAVMVSGYLFVGWVVAVVLFLRRDAN
jgi:ABC-type transport system involved in multi-copper enzyme maturation permease subunit